MAVIKMVNLLLTWKMQQEFINFGIEEETKSRRYLRLFILWKISLFIVKMANL